MKKHSVKEAAAKAAEAAHIPKIPKNKAYAFWHYDLYPYMRGGKVTAIVKGKAGEKDHVYLEQYGNFAFYPRYYTDEKKGKALLEQIESLDAEYNEAQKALKGTYIKKLNGALRQAGVKRKPWLQ